MKILQKITLILALSSSLLISSCSPSISSEESLTSESISLTSESTSQTSESTSQTSESTSSSDNSSCTLQDDARWPGLDFSSFGTTFRNKLASLISGKTATYSDCLSIGYQAAAYPNDNSSTFIPFYHEANENEAHARSGCNREHTWPKSRGGNLIENDPIVIRPTLTADNSSRANYFYGTGSYKEWDPASKTSNGSSYLGARGESARVILYAACRYYSQGLTLSNNPNDATSAKTMGTLKTLLQWNMEYQPTAFERKVNERYAAMGYARNPFVDHPIYANFIWDENGIRTSAYNISTCPADSTDYGSSSSSSIPPTSSSSSEEVIESNDVEYRYTLPVNDFPKTYDDDDHDIAGLKIHTTSAASGFTSGAVQMKKGGVGQFYNLQPLEGLEYLILKKYDGKEGYNSDPVVTFGNEVNPDTEASVITKDGFLYYSLLGASYFKVTSGTSNATYLSEIHLN